jgi:hypothetical protein
MPIPDLTTRTRGPVFAALAALMIELGAAHAQATPPRGDFRPVDGKGPLTSEMEADIDRCFDLAREKDANVTIDAVARIEAALSGAVISVSVPTPNAPQFQTCVEAAAMRWSFPPPPSPPGDHPPEGARLYLQFPIQRPRG